MFSTHKHDNYAVADYNLATTYFMETRMKSFKEQLNQYAASHQSSSNRLAHFIGVPAIIFGALILLSWISVSFATSWHITFAWIAVILALIMYFRMNVKLACVMTIILVVFVLIASWIGYPKPTVTNVIIFAIFFGGGWVLQFIGNTFEKSKSSIFQSASQLFFAPMFLLVELLKVLKLDGMFDLQDESSSPSSNDDKE